MQVRIILIAFIATISFGCGDTDDAPENSVSGTVTINGQPADFQMIVFQSADGTEQSGPSMAGNTYRVDDPPNGKLTVWFAAGPAIPGASQKSVGNIPAKYTSDKSNLTFEYVGGKLNQDFDLRP